MKNPFVWLDSLIIEQVFEPFAWRVEYHFGKNNFWLARVCGLILSAPGYLISFWWMSQGLVQEAIAFFIMVSVVLASGLLYILDLEKRVRGKEVANPKRYSLGWVALRLLFIIGSGLRLLTIIPALLQILVYAILELNYQNLYLVLATSVFLVLFQLSLPSVLYFMACSNMPPKWKKARDEKVADKMVLQAT